MILRRPYTLPSALLYLLLLTTRFAYAEEDSPFDCRVAVEGVKFDLTSLAGEHTASQKRKTPPTTTLDLVRFDLCAELRKQEDVAEGDQSLSLTILCSTRETPEPVFKSYDGATVVIEWSAPAGCPVEGGNNGGDDKDGGNYDSKPPEDDKNESAGSGIGWFFLV
ncbi:hypothetical protein H0H87_007945 [Tephrocybe sp. NHM501043]|nr:hypothetical protein H0H87_007945 [Tephrocybe sp. NHM501043]